MTNQPKSKHSAICETKINVQLMSFRFLERVSHRVVEPVVPYPLNKIIEKWSHATWLL